MFEKLSDYTILANGVKMPCIGYGTWKTPSGQIAADLVRTAIELGYRHIDTASGYANEDGVGDGVRASGVARDELFITTKHWIVNRGYEKTIAACEESLRCLGMDYVDLYLIHWPAVAKTRPDWEEVNADTWRGFERLYKDGKIRAVGVSNFLPAHLESLKKYVSVLPMVNQIEFHPGYTQPEVVSYCQQNNITVQAWSPLGSGAVLENPLLGEIAAKYGKSVAQLCIRFALQNNIIPLPKSMSAQRIAANTNVFDFAITDEDMARMHSMPLTGYSGFYPEEAPADKLVYGE